MGKNSYKVYKGGGSSTWSGGWWSKNTAADLQQEMTGTTAVFGRDKGIAVSFGGDKAETKKDGSVVFPQLDPTLTFDWKSMQLFRGWVDSEAAIARFSNRPFIANQEKLKETNARLYDVFKAVEGARAENHYTDFYAGAGKNLATLSEALLQKGSSVFKDSKDFYPTAIGMFARGRMQGVFNGFNCTEMAKHVDRGMVEAWVDEIETLNSTEESFELARRIVEDIENQPQPEPQDGSGEGEGDSDSKEADGKGEPTPTTGLVEALINDKIKDAKDAADSLFKHDPSDENGPYIPLTTECDRVYHWANSKDGWAEDIAKYMRIKGSMDASLATAKRKLELMIQATQKISWDTMKERGRLDSRRLVGAYQGEQNVFKIKRDESDMDTAVSICVDLSGSMSGTKAKYAFMATIVFSELLQKIGVPFEVMGFDATTDNLTGEWAYKAHSASERKYGRIDSLRTHDFKRFGDRFFDARKYMHRIYSLAGSGSNNVDGESIMIAARSLMKRPEKRKIMLVISDGQPHAHGNTSRQQGHLKKTVKEIARHAEIVGIGLCTDTVKHFYQDYILVDNAENLPIKMLDLLAKKLLPSEIAKKPAASVTASGA